MNEITINNYIIPIKEYNGQRVVTFKDIDSVHDRADGTARKRFNDNRERFIYGEDYFVRNSDEAKKEFGITAPNGLTIITETGYLMLVKSFTDDLAWDVQRALVNCYFKAKDYNECYSTDDFESERTIDSEQLIKCAEIMAGCLDGNKIYVLNILRHIVPDISEMPFSYEEDFDAVDISDKTHIKSSVPIAGYSINFDAQKFDRYLRENDISSLELSERLQCGSGNPWKWRSGTVSPGTYYRTKICEVLELPIGYFDKKTRKRR